VCSIVNCELRLRRDAVCRIRSCMGLFQVPQLRQVVQRYQKHLSKCPQPTRAIKAGDTE